MIDQSTSATALPIKRMLWFHIAFWLVLWLFSVWNNYQWVSSAGNSFNWGLVFSWSFPYYLLMIPLGPLIFQLYHHWRFYTYAKQCLYHLFPALLTGFIHQLALNGFYAYFNQGPNGSFTELLAARYQLGFAFSTNGFLFYWLCLGLIFSFALYYNYRRQQLSNLALTAALSEAQFQSLQSQLQPHFLFNTFNSIAMMARQEKHKEVVEMIAHLSDLLRGALVMHEDQQVPLEKELTMVDHYLQIEKMRFRDRLHLSLNIAEEALAVQVPSLFLQPIIENAFQHGISKIEGEANFLLDIGVIESRLLIVVSNSGPLLPADWILDDHLGIGLSNILKRLDHLFPNDHHFQLENLRDQTGVSVTINLPLG